MKPVCRTGVSSYVHRGVGLDANLGFCLATTRTPPVEVLRFFYALTSVCFLIVTTNSAG